jgi:NAD-dependent DNA ligase
MILMERCPNCGHVLTNHTCLNCKLDDYDNNAYLKFTRPQIIEKSIHTLAGILNGISIDQEINSEEVSELKNWYETHQYFFNIKPYNELLITLSNFLADNIITKEEKDELLWLCNNLQSESSYYSMVTSDLQILQGILHGILADGRITKAELEGLRNWLADSEHLATNYPYDEIYSLVLSVLEDGIVSQEEEIILKEYFAIFCEIPVSKLLTGQELLELKQSTSINGICATDPNIIFKNNLFCFTGKSSKSTRNDIAKIIESANGTYKDTVTSNTNYLIVGDDGNPCWAFACYGRKVEKAITLRKNGNNIILVHEVDFWDSL